MLMPLSARGLPGWNSDATLPPNAGARLICS